MRRFVGGVWPEVWRTCCRRLVLAAKKSVRSWREKVLRRGPVAPREDTLSSPRLLGLLLAQHVSYDSKSYMFRSKVIDIVFFFFFFFFFFAINKGGDVMKRGIASILPIMRTK